ncbi:MAG: hypothetical protein COB02_12695 [Candidatus Cloacimonadota bacterium]|nr:MAG: hypothetical protein COB02_12695 [Candidatus Cloacimonadota bacterium]
MNPKEIEKTLVKAIELVESGQKIEALEYFEKLDEHAANDAQVLYNVGIYYSSIGEHLKASDRFDKCCKLEESNESYQIRGIVENFHIGGGQLMESDFMAYDVCYLTKAKESADLLLEKNPKNEEALDLKEKIENTIIKSRLAFKFLEGDLEYCRRTITRRRELNVLDERVLGFLNLLDSGEYEHTIGNFRVDKRKGIQESQGGFLERLRNYVLGIEK